MPQSQNQENRSLTVSAAESGMKLLRFLERRLEETGTGMLHKWIRSGQVRVNKGRAKAFDTLAQGDQVRVPPFARIRTGTSQNVDFLLDAAVIKRYGVGVLAENDEYLVLVKPAGLPSQGGTGHALSLASLLAEACVGSSYIPAPSHRLDKDTSGLVMVGKTFEAQQRLHSLFRGDGITKDYLAWVQGKWPHEKAVLLSDRLEKKAGSDGRERMHADKKKATLTVLPVGDAIHPEAGKALCAVALVAFMPEGSLPGNLKRISTSVSLVLVRLFTGQTHQIRVQLSSRGFPIIGDVKYGGPRFERMLLHAWAITLPDWQGSASARYKILPDWPEAFDVRQENADKATELLDRSL